MLHLKFETFNVPQLKIGLMKDLDIANLLAGESLTIEYKDDSKKDFSDDLVIKACVGLSNAEGGTLLIGISDSGEVIGSSRANTRWATSQSLEGMIRNRTNPNLNTQVVFVPYQGKIIVVVNIPKATNVVSTSSGVYLKRQLNSYGKPENRAMSSDDILRAVSRFGMNDLSADVLHGVTMEDIDLDLVRQISDQILEKSPTEGDKEIFTKESIEVLKAIGLTDRSGSPNIAAILLFGKEETIRERIPNHFVQYQAFGTSGEILKNEKYYLPIVKLIPLLLGMPELSRNSNELIVDGQSVVIPEYSKAGLREAISNSFAHRDYTMHSGIQIQVFPSELKISSAGGFLDGININNLLSTPPTPRNRRLSEAMMRLKFVETSGRGIDIIFYSQARYGRPAPDYSETTNSTVIVRLVGGTANLEFCRYIMTLGQITLMEMLILNAIFYERSINVSTASHLLQTSERTAKQILSELLKKGWLEIFDEQNPVYLLKGTLRNKKIRLTESIQLEMKEKVLNLLEKHPELNREGIGRVLNLTQTQTYRLLSQLQNEGKISLKGKKWVKN